MDIDDEMRSDTQSVVSASTATGSRSSMLTSIDGTPAPSVYSYRSERDGRAMLREIAGRILNSTNELYLLPACNYLLFSDYMCQCREKSCLTKALS